MPLNTYRSALEEFQHYVPLRRFQFVEAFADYEQN